jgi:hypothetical protein
VLSFLPEGHARTHLAWVLRDGLHLVHASFGILS